MSLAATRKYITDEFEVTLRSGTSTTNEILQMLKSGQALNVIEDDLETGYSLALTDDGKQGYVLSRYLVDLPPAKQRLEQLQLSTAEQSQENLSFKAEVAILQTSLDIQQSDNNRLKEALLISEEKLDQVRITADNALELIEKNKTLVASLGQLQKQNLTLSEENAALKDSTKLDWFIRGGAVALIAFVIGILITRIRWKKQQSWGAY